MAAAISLSVEDCEDDEEADSTEGLIMLTSFYSISFSLVPFGLFYSYSFYSFTASEGFLSRFLVNNC